MLGATLPLPHAGYEVNNGKSIAKPLPHPMMEGECLVQFTYAKEYTLCAIQWILSVDLCGLPVIPWVLLGIATVIIAKFLLRKYPAWDSKKKDSKGHPNKPRHEKWFYAWIIGVAVLGGTWAFFLPIAINSGFGKDDDGAALRQALIYTTGGILGVITLGETHRKNTFEKTKNDQDHTRQVHAERRSRYTKAIEHLFNENISVRLGGVYALAGLADEWLTDEKTLLTDKERHKEGQVIINTLCSYIRSSFNLASKAEVLTKDEAPGNYEGGDQQFIKDQAKLREEEELRLAILEAIKNRLNDDSIDGTNKLSKGLWSDFDYDFSNAYFFYPIGFTNSYFGASSKFSGATFTENADFSKTAFTERAPFSGATFTCAHFYEATFTERAPFSGATFTGNADFSGAEFTQDADFSEAEFTGNAHFFEAKFTGNAHFFEAKFAENANFYKAEFTGNAHFSEAKFTKDAHFFWAKFTKDAHFSRAKFTQNAHFSEAKFTQNADFSRAKFTQNAHFFWAKFTGNAHFFWAKFTQNADFSRAKFTQNADFAWAEFTQNANFFEATFEEKPIFVDIRWGKTYKAKFSHRANPEDYNFKVSDNSRYKIETEEKEYDGVKFIIPKDAELFDPDEPSEQGNNDGS